MDDSVGVETWGPDIRLDMGEQRGIGCVLAGDMDRRSEWDLIALR